MTLRTNLASSLRPRRIARSSSRYPNLERISGSPKNDVSVCPVDSSSRGPLGDSPVSLSNRAGNEGPLSPRRPGALCAGMADKNLLEHQLVFLSLKNSRENSSPTIRNHLLTEGLDIIQIT